MECYFMIGVMIAIYREWSFFKIGYDISKRRGTKLIELKEIIGGIAMFPILMIFWPIIVMQRIEYLIDERE